MIGTTEVEFFENATGEPVYPILPADAYDAVFDFGCGCGADARLLLQQQRDRPRRYVGIDVHRGMILLGVRIICPRSLPIFSLLASRRLGSPVMAGTIPSGSRPLFPSKTTRSPSSSPTRSSRTSTKSRSRLPVRDCKNHEGGWSCDDHLVLLRQRRFSLLARWPALPVRRRKRSHVGGYLRLPVVACIEADSVESDAPPQHRGGARSGNRALACDTSGRGRPQSRRRRRTQNEAPATTGAASATDAIPGPI